MKIRVWSSAYVPVWEKKFPDTRTEDLCVACVSEWEMNAERSRWIGWMDG